MKKQIIPNIRCFNCGEDAVTLVKTGSPIGDILSADCEACECDVKDEIDDIFEDMIRNKFE